MFTRLPCPRVVDAIAYVQNAMRYDPRLPMCEILDAHESADVSLSDGHFYFVSVTARYIDEWFGEPAIANWSVWYERAEDGSYFVYGEW